MEDNILEQPIPNLEDSQAVNTEIVEGQSEEKFGLGSNSKFKTVDDLNTAYNNLQAEFTRKCQSLKELERSMENNSPRYKLDSWNTELSNFFEKYPRAKEYSNEIAKSLLEDEDLAKKSDCLTIVWANILNNLYRKEEDLVLDSNFLEKHIYSNDNIKDEIIKKYLSAIEKAPTLINDSRGAYNIAPKSKPKNMSDAYSIVSELFR